MGIWRIVVLVVMVLAACATTSSPVRVLDAPAAETPAVEAPPPQPAEDEPTVSLVADDLFPEVIAVSATALGDCMWRFDVTMTSEYDSPARYADAWRVLDASDNELGIRVLTHDHAAEQPFTRSTTIEIPSHEPEVFVEGRDQRNGWSGQRFEVALAEEAQETASADEVVACP